MRQLLQLCCMAIYLKYLIQKRESEPHISRLVTQARIECLSDCNKKWIMSNVNKKRHKHRGGCLCGDQRKLGEGAANSQTLTGKGEGEHDSGNTGIRGQ